MTPMTTSSTSAACFLGGVRRTFSGSAILPSSTGSTVSDPERTTAGNDNAAVAGEAGAGTIKAPAIPRRSIGRLSTVFTGAAQPSAKYGCGPSKAASRGFIGQPAHRPVSLSRHIRDTFENPIQALSPDTGDDTTKHGANAKALNVVSPSSPEPPTSTPNSIVFGSGTTGASAGHLHVRNTSIAFIINKGNTVTPKPSTSSTKSKVPQKRVPGPVRPGRRVLLCVRTVEGIQDDGAMPTRETSA
ncbi:hypothetical protein M408DRAFT_30413 [Serendipita vermifera MAFF 305830]|uniref:Uncharacterized protein n=1 Tax=Serendipita vermifera MAFF 305830 TaxID=933852 RepID=A0A0C3AJZ3_SERVB|nr:hypothetical protein M408DRAFT_30413 [Serendipita vermifera MAFF 305830]